MFVVEKVARNHRYLYLVESVREPGGRVRQRILQPLGRKDLLIAGGELERLLESLGRHSEHSLILSEMAAGSIACRRVPRQSKGLFSDNQRHTYQWKLLPLSGRLSSPKPPQAVA